MVRVTPHSNLGRNKLKIIPPPSIESFSRGGRNSFVVLTSLSLSPTLLIIRNGRNVPSDSDNSAVFETARQRGEKPGGKSLRGPPPRACFRRGRSTSAKPHRSNCPRPRPEWRSRRNNDISNVTRYLPLATSPQYRFY